MKKTKAILLAVVSLGSLILASMCVNALETPDIVGYEDNGELLGVSTAFGVFTEGDAGFNGADLEARLACGGSANVGSFEYYSVAKTRYADVICEGGELKNFDRGNHLFAVGNDTVVKIPDANVVRGDWIDFEGEFEKLRTISSDLDTVSTGIVEIDSGWASCLNFIGADENINFFDLNLNEINSDKFFFNFDVPKGSYSVVNITGSTLYTQLYGCTYAGEHIQSNTDPLVSHILFNYTGEKLELSGIGTLYGTVLAPNAFVYDNMTSGAHCSGSIIAKSFLGGIEVGGTSWNYIENTDDSSIADDSSTESCGIDESSAESLEDSSLEDSSLIEDSSSVEDSSLEDSSLIEDSSSVEDSSLEDSSSVEDSSLIESNSSSISSESFTENSSSSKTTSSLIDSSTSKLDDSPATGDLTSKQKATLFLLLLILAVSIIIDKIRKDHDR